MWKPSNDSNVFLNVDGSSSNNSMAIEGELWNSRGGVLGTVIGPMGIGSPIEAKAWELKHRMQLVKNRLVTKLNIWMDSAIVAGRLMGHPLYGPFGTYGLL